MYIVQLSDKGFYVSHREATIYDTWSYNEIRDVDLPALSDGKFYKWNGEWTEYSEEEYLVEISPTEEEIAASELYAKLSEAHNYLNKTDYKMLNNYVAKEEEDIEAIIAQRNEYRDFIRANE